MLRRSRYGLGTPKLLGSPIQVPGAAQLVLRRALGSALSFQPKNECWTSAIDSQLGMRAHAKSNREQRPLSCVQGTRDLVFPATACHVSDIGTPLHEAVYGASTRALCSWI